MKTKQCCNCGVEQDECLMEKIVTSRAQYLCWECFKMSQQEASGYHYDRAKAAEKKKQREGKL